MSWLLVVGIVLVAILIFVWFFAKHLLKWIINSLIGFFGLLGWNVLFPSVALDVNFWSVALVAIGGIFGLILVLILHLTGIAF